ncbi:hypothetical protein A3C34_04300 [Candidatus Amesbacteria bacterium RIFCSPHIGHO2_02_FULL_48_21]|uniref:Cytosine-specific methyltransferase n=1 Tax=Candidatus Amesbacteria bacterium GW2011_GWA2_47_11 TaxID=1618357 RepID=A0A0G1RCD0_9BACT|nr:MAG: hypothetical protein UX78_C0033G0007 [Candidatus Amesbacteria bacterium GW2011_GWA2_47_11]OGC48541.1 MAG: hypothetical protein A3F07_04075 [candidate division WWE3 bacterium RIFCSPHIGHO2_12_FULL_38_15]OGC96677.1 MAG: hypothetical protein A3C34_04300 [Candidatus Amesbacteria bacterium RIFCSPHIGHO2_02_FULL_48_21]
MRKNKKTLSDRPVLIDLFAGAGGLSIGLEQAGFKLVAATDWDHWSCETLRANHKGAFVAEGDINEVDLDDFAGKLSADEVDLIVGGPPCQGFSALGKRSKSDPRNQLWRQYMRFVEYFNPKVFLMENVPELLKSEEYAQIKKTAEKLGYQVKEKILFAPDYGVPQKRKRAIILGSRIGEPKFPNPTHALPGQMTLDNYNCAPWKNVRDAISDLPLDPDGNNWHVGRNPTKKSLKRYKSVPPGGNRFNLPQDLMPECWKRKKTGSTDVFGRLEWDKPSLTVRTEFFKPEKGRYLHPEAHRPITIREAARLQTIPDSYILKGSHLEVAKQIGNAVPCELARNIGEELLKLFNADSDSVQDKRVYGSTGFEGLLAYQQP